jgi:streptogramin lyase
VSIRWQPQKRHEEQGNLGRSAQFRLSKLSRRPWFIATLTVAALQPYPALCQAIVEFPALGQSPTSALVSGPDGNLYFGGGRISLDGTVALFGPGPQDCPPPDSGPATLVNTLAFGSDGNLWFTSNCPGHFPPYPAFTDAFIGRMSQTGVQGMIINSQPMDLVLGPDGNLWFSGGGVSRITADFVITRFDLPGPPGSGTTSGLANGPDGNIWFTSFGKIGKISTSGVVTQYDLPSSDHYPGFITAGPDGNIWFTETRHRANGFQFFIARSTLSGQITEYALPPAEPGRITGPGRITAGPDGNVWFTEPGDNLVRLSRIGRITPDGTITEFSTPTSNSGPTGITTGSDGNIWFMEPSVGKIGRVNLNQNGTCIPTATALCLGGARFRAEAQWRRPTDSAPSAGNAVSITADTGYFWFFDASNIEVVVKVLNGCPVDGHYWVFAGGLTNVEVTLTVTETNTGTTRTYTNPLGTAFLPIQDTSAFATCP